MSKKLKKGLLIVFEGIDGCGKSTQARLAYEYVINSGYEAIALKEYTNGKWGQKIKELSQKGRKNVTPYEEFELFRKDRIEDVELNIKPALRSKKIIILDRYYFSSMAYQGGRGLDVKMIQEENEKIAPIPDMVFYIRVDINTGLKRIFSNRKNQFDDFEKKTFLKKVVQIFDNMKFDYFITINGDREVDTIHQEIKSHIDKLIKKYST
jgi:dTMP kinase